MQISRFITVSVFAFLSLAVSLALLPHEAHASLATVSPQAGAAN